MKYLYIISVSILILLSCNNGTSEENEILESNKISRDADSVEHKMNVLRDSLNLYKGQSPGLDKDLAVLKDSLDNAKRYLSELRLLISKKEDYKHDDFINKSNQLFSVISNALTPPQKAAQFLPNYTAENKQKFDSLLNLPPDVKTVYIQGKTDTSYKAEMRKLQAELSDLKSQLATEKGKKADSLKALIDGINLKMGNLQAQIDKIPEFSVWLIEPVYRDDDKVIRKIKDGKPRAKEVDEVQIDIKAVVYSKGKKVEKKYYLNYTIVPKNGDKIVVESSKLKIPGTSITYQRVIPVTQTLLEKQIFTINKLEKVAGKHVFTLYDEKGVEVDSNSQLETY